MPTKKRYRGSSPATVRVSVTFPKSLYMTMAQLARQRKVSAAWIIRDAVERYATDQWPLLAATDRQSQ